MLITTSSQVTSTELVEPVTLEQVQSALAILGIEVPLTRVAEVHMDPQSIEVTLYVLDERDRMVAAGDEAAKLVLKAPISRG